MPLFNHFDFLAPIYDKVIRSGASPRLVELLDLQPGQLVLDAAGGTGRIARWLAPQARRLVVADLSFPMLRRASGLERVCASTLALPYAGGCFDRILMVDALHHVFGQVQAVRELARVLKPGGRLVIEEPDIATRPVKWVAFAEKIAGMGSVFLSVKEGKRLFDGLPGIVNYHQAEYTTWWWFEKC